MARISRAESTRLTRARILAEAERLFREQGYASTSMDQIAEGAAVTKGAIYGHFASKEELLICAIDPGEDSEYAPLYDPAVPIRERVRAYGRARASAPPDDVGLAVLLEFIAACIRNPQGRERFAEMLREEINQRVSGDEDEPLHGTTKEQVWVTGHALMLGLRVYRVIAPELITPDAFARAFELLAGLYPER
jgi:AcrR family transcriptional regulator